MCGNLTRLKAPAYFLNKILLRYKRERVVMSERAENLIYIYILRASISIVGMLHREAKLILERESQIW